MATSSWPLMPNTGLSYPKTASTRMLVASGSQLHIRELATGVRDNVEIASGENIVALAGAEVVPEALYFYRRSPDSMKGGQTCFDAGAVRALDPYLRELPDYASDTLRFLAAHYHGNPEGGRSGGRDLLLRRFQELKQWIRRALIR